MGNIFDLIANGLLARVFFMVRHLSETVHVSLPFIYSYEPPNTNSSVSAGFHYMKGSRGWRRETAVTERMVSGEQAEEAIVVLQAADAANGHGKEEARTMDTTVWDAGEDPDHSQQQQHGNRSFVSQPTSLTRALKMPVRGVIFFAFIHIITDGRVF